MGTDNKQDAPRGALRPRSQVRREVVVTGEKLGPPVEEDFLDEHTVVAHVGDKPKAPVKPLVFPSANRLGGEVPLSGDFERVVEAVYVEHPFDEYRRLEQELSLGEQRTDRGSVQKALDRAESNARAAHRLWMAARVEHRRWELENEVVFAAMRTEATMSLQREKVAGERSKQITDADVESRCASLYPDEYKAQAVREKRVDGMVKSMEHLCVVWTSRCRSLQELSSRQR